MADGDFSAKVDLRRGDEHSLLHAMSQMQAQLSGMVRDFKESAESIGTASREIAAGNQDLSERTERQAGSLEQTSGNMQVLTDTVRQSAEAASQANRPVPHPASSTEPGRYASMKSASPCELRPDSCTLAKRA